MKSTSAQAALTPSTKCLQVKYLHLKINYWHCVANYYNFANTI